MASNNRSRKPVPAYIPPQPALGRRVSMNTGNYESGGTVPWGQSRGSNSPVYSQPPAYQSSDSVQYAGTNEASGYAAEPAVVSTAPLLLSVSIMATSPHLFRPKYADGFRYYRRTAIRSRTLKQRWPLHSRHGLRSRRRNRSHRPWIQTIQADSNSIQHPTIPKSSRRRR